MLNYQSHAASERQCGGFAYWRGVCVAHVACKVAKVSMSGTGKK